MRSIQSKTQAAFGTIIASTSHFKEILVMKAPVAVFATLLTMISVAIPVSTIFYSSPVYARLHPQRAGVMDVPTLDELNRELKRARISWHTIVSDVVSILVGSPGNRRNVLEYGDLSGAQGTRVSYGTVRIDIQSPTPTHQNIQIQINGIRGIRTTIATVLVPRCFVNIVGRNNDPGVQAAQSEVLNVVRRALAMSFHSTQRYVGGGTSMAYQAHITGRPSSLPIACYNNPSLLPVLPFIRRYPK